MEESADENEARERVRELRRERLLGMLSAERQRTNRRVGPVGGVSK